MKRIVLSDLHIPHHDSKAVQVALNFIQDQQPDAVDLLGDIIDCYDLSSFDRNPQRKENFQNELDQTRQFMSYLREIVPKAEIIYKEGNHEDRMRRYKWRKTPELAHLTALTLPSLLGLRDLNISHRCYKSPYKVQGLWYHHGFLIRKHAGLSALAHCEKIGGSVICGHSHRQGMSRFTDWNRTYTGYENGCLCKLSPNYGHNRLPNWQHGFSVVEFYKNMFEVTQLQITQGKLLYRGYEYEA